MLVNAYFGASAVICFWYARNKKFREHREWAFRHIAMGYFAPVHRLVLHFGIIGGFYSGLIGETEFTAFKKIWFIIAEFIAVIVNIGCTEYWLYTTRKTSKKTT